MISKTVLSVPNPKTASVLADKPIALPVKEHDKQKYTRRYCLPS